MKPTPRTRRLAFALAAASSLAFNLIAPPLDARQRDASVATQSAPAPAAKQTAKAAPAAKAQEQKERRQALKERQQAVAAINEAAGSSRSIESPPDRVAVLAAAADALWPFEEQAARSLFARAWEEAAASDKKEAADFKAHTSGPDADDDGPPSALGPAPEAFTQSRLEVIAVASRHDARLTEHCIKELRESVESQRGGDGQRADDAARRYDVHDSFFSAFDFDQLRLNLSRSLADEGDYEQAAEVAAPEVAGGAASALLRFLIQFRESAPAEADALYTRLLQRTASDPNAGPNDVLLLSSYALTPTLLAVVDARGSVNFNPVYREGGTELAPVGTRTPEAANVRQLFFNTAAAILLRARASAPPDSQGETAAAFFAVSRLLPFFEREAPQFAPQLYARRQALAAELQAASRDSLAALAKTDKLAPDNPTDPLRGELEALKSPSSSAAERDAMRVEAVAHAARLKLWERARAFASEIEDADKRAAALRLVAACQVASAAEAFNDDEDGDERAAQFIQSADVVPAVRALGYARAALLASKKSHKALAAELLGRAQGFAEQADPGTETRLTALVVVAATAGRLDDARAWAVLPEVVRAANEVRDASPDEISGGFKAPRLDAGVAGALGESHESLTLGEGLDSFRLDLLFAALAARDAARALTQARSLADQTTRALVLIAAARAALAKNQGGTPPRAGAR